MATLENVGWLDLQIMDAQSQIDQRNLFPRGILAISSLTISSEVCESVLKMWLKICKILLKTAPGFGKIIQFSRFFDISAQKFPFFLLKRNLLR